MDVLLGAKITRDGHTVEVAERLNDTGILDGPDVEQEDQRGEQDCAKCHSDANQHQLAPTVVNPYRDER